MFRKMNSMQFKSLKDYLGGWLHFLDKCIRVPCPITLVVSFWLIASPRRGEAFEAFVAPENFFPPLPHHFFPYCSAGLRSSCDLRLGSQRNAQSGSLCGLLGNVLWKLFYERRYSLRHDYLPNNRTNCQHQVLFHRHCGG